MGEGLPVGWVETRIGNVMGIRNGYAFKSKDFQDNGVPLIKQSNLIGDFVSIEKCKYLDKKYLIEKSKFILQKDDILIGMSGSLGKVSVYSFDFPALQNQRTGKLTLVSSENLSRNLFLYYFNNISNILEKSGKGCGVQNISGGDIETLPLPLPPLNEQKRIVAKLDAIMPRIEAVKERLERVPVILKRYRQAVLTAAVTGRLTESWREEHPNVERAKVLLKDIIIGKPRNGYSPTAVKYETSVKSLTLTATTSGKFDSSCYKYIDEVIPKDSHLWLEKDDILIQRSNSINYVGISAIYPGNSFEFIYPDLMMKIKTAKDLVLPSFLVLSLQSHKTLDYLRKNATGTAGSMPKINQTTVMNAPISLPSLEEQKEIVRQVDKLFALADKVEAHYNEAKARVDKLSQSVLAKAFRGELVPQDPNDEPAEKLLERIMEEKARMEAELKAIKKATKKSKKQ